MPESRSAAASDYELKVSIRIGNAVHPTSDFEFMQVIVCPVHDGLDDAMELRQREINGYQDPPPNRRRGADKRKVELKHVSQSMR